MAFQQVFPYSRNRYSLEFYKDKRRVLTLHYSHSPMQSSNWANSRRIYHDYVNVYDRKSKEYIGRFYPVTNY